MKRVSFFLTLLVVLVGIPLVAAEPSGEVPALRITGFDMDFVDFPILIIKASLNEPLAKAMLTSHPGSCSVDRNTFICSALVPGGGQITFLIDVYAVNGVKEEVFVKGFYPGGELSIGLPDESPSVLMPPRPTTRLEFASANPDKDIHFTQHRIV